MANNEQLLSQFHVAFRYIIEIDGKRLAAFTECTLPTIEWEMEEVKEGGLNTYVHQLPGRRKASRLTLKQGVGKNVLFDWYLKTLNETFEPRDITVSLLDVTGADVATWIVGRAYPIKWTGPQLKSDSNVVAIQTLEFACAEVLIDSTRNSARSQLRDQRTADARLIRN